MNIEVMCNLIWAETTNCFFFFFFFFFFFLHFWHVWNLKNYIYINLIFGLSVFALYDYFFTHKITNISFKTILEIHSLINILCDASIMSAHFYFLDENSRNLCEIFGFFVFWFLDIFDNFIPILWQFMAILYQVHSFNEWMNVCISYPQLYYKKTYFIFFGSNVSYFWQNEDFSLLG